MTTESDLKLFLANNNDSTYCSTKYLLHFNNNHPTVKGYLKNVPSSITITFYESYVRLCGAHDSLCNDIFSTWRNPNISHKLFFDACIKKKYFTHISTQSKPASTITELFNHITSNSKLNETVGHNIYTRIGNDYIVWRNTDHEFRRDSREISEINGIKKYSHVPPSDPTYIKMLCDMYSKLTGINSQTVFNQLSQMTPVNTLTF